MEEGIGLGRRPELVGGGLIRSLGGWSSVLALRRRGEKQVSDERILGEADFVQAVLSEMNDRTIEKRKVSGFFPVRRVYLHWRTKFVSFIELFWMNCVRAVGGMRLWRREGSCRRLPFSFWDILEPRWHGILGSRIPVSPVPFPQRKWLKICESVMANSRL
jgi:hypothetical protein